ncbi:hypothetical protein [Sphingobium aquiterrae]|uniref:hypothetical protein n=1 Tax=Sphingobium aquiterrae TaxID=2038656 RepID=UPI003016509A
MKSYRRSSPCGWSPEIRAETGIFGDEMRPMTNGNRLAGNNSIEQVENSCWVSRHPHSHGSKGEKE